MPNFCNLIVIGHLVRDVELKETKSGNKMVNNCVAYNRKKGGESHATFLDFTLFGNGAEIMSQYLSKGDPVLLTGYLEQNNWTNEDGDNRSKLQMVAQRMDFVGSQGDDSNGSSVNGGNGRNRSSMRGGFSPNPPKKEKGEWDDIPF